MDEIAEIGNSDWKPLGVVVVALLLIWRLMYNQSKQNNKLINTITDTTGGNTKVLKDGLKQLEEGFKWQGKKIEGVEEKVQEVSKKLDTHIKYSKDNLVKKDELENEVKKTMNIYRNDR